MGYSVPEIIEYDLDQRFILLEDLGDKTFTQCLKKNHKEKELYQTATEVIIDLHKRYKNDQDSIPVYTIETYRKECDTLLDWYYPNVMGKTISSNARTEWGDVWNTLLKNHLTLPKTLALRDFHVDNLLWLDQRMGLQKCGLLDFQDALMGSPAYDLVSLFEDARRDVDENMTEELLNFYFLSFPDLDREQFRIEYNILGAQRSAKIIGYFTRLAMRDKKVRYLDFIPRTWKWLEKDLQHPSLKDIKNWMDEYIPAEKRSMPNVTN
jgi:aminoglycoside/choline kinase family phosphotransferase